MKSEYLIIKEIIGIDTAVSTDDGEKVFQKIDKFLKEGTDIELDFKDICIMTTAFLNAAIGQLYSAYDSEQLNKHLKLENLTSENKIRLKQVIDRAKEYFANKKRFEDSADKTIYGE